MEMPALTNCNVQEVVLAIAEKAIKTHPNQQKGISKIMGQGVNLELVCKNEITQTS